MSERPILVWDLPQRLFHWSLVALCALSWWSGEEGGVMLKYHLWSGYAVLTLVLFRIGWGFVGSRHARFGDFLRGPHAILHTLRALPGREALPHAGHNPVGGLMVLALLLVLGVQTGTGLFANDDIMNEGPLYALVSKSMSDRLTGWHEIGFYLLLALVALHVGAILWHRLRKGEHLIRAMITGRKSLPATEAPLLPVGLERAALVLLVCAAAVWLLVQWPTF